jgi:hypothetical protein
MTARTNGCFRCHDLRIPLFMMVLGLSVPGFASASVQDEMACAKGRIDAASRFYSCQQKLISKIVATGSAVGLDAKMAKCRSKYASAWLKIQAHAAGTGATCDSADRFVDNGDGTVTDLFTGLVWEKKTNDASVHDVGMIFRLDASGITSLGDGAAYTTFLAALNDGCFAGRCDWRIPTLAELQTMRAEPCTTPTCVDAAFGPSDGQYFWTSTPKATEPDRGWTVRFSDGALVDRSRGEDFRVRAVRGQLP